MRGWLVTRQTVNSDGVVEDDDVWNATSIEQVCGHQEQSTLTCVEYLDRSYTLLATSDVVFVPSAAGVWRREEKVEEQVEDGWRASGSLRCARRPLNLGIPKHLPMSYSTTTSITGYELCSLIRRFPVHLANV